MHTIEYRPMRIILNKTEGTMEVIDGGSAESDNYDVDVLTVKHTRRIRKNNEVRQYR